MVSPLPPMLDTDAARLRDIGLQEDALGKQLSRLRRERDKIFAARALLDQRQITDHAIVRYLERVTGTDTEAIKTAIRVWVGHCAPTGVKGVLIHPSGLQCIINAHGVVVTILPAGSPLGYESGEVEKDT